MESAKVEVLRPFVYIKATNGIRTLNELEISWPTKVTNHRGRYNSCFEFGESGRIDMMCRNTSSRRAQARSLETLLE